MILLSVGVVSTFLSPNPDVKIAEVTEFETSQTEKTILPQSKESVNDGESGNFEVESKSTIKAEPIKNFSKKESSKNIVPIKSSKIESVVKQPKTRKSNEEIKQEVKTESKTDFIALSYSSATDSGQIVRVKVPSSMMVSLGVTTEAEQESKFVNAEVVIGDDGMARAIRFIR